MSRSIEVVRPVAPPEVTLQSPAPSPDEPLSALAVAAIAGGRPEVEALFIALLPRVRNLVRYLVRGDREVDDLSQEALVCVLKALPSYRGDGPFRSWADRVVARSVFRRLKSVRRLDRASEPLGEQQDEAVDSSTAGADHHRYVERRRLVARLDTLPEVQRTALVLHHVLGMTVAEVASELSTPQETVRSRLRLGRERMRHSLRPPAIEPTVAPAAVSGGEG